MNLENISNKEKLESDVVVIGAGGAGLAAAVAVAENGARVIVVERRSVPGGNTVFAEGLFAAESPLQKRMNIDARRDELFKRAMDFSHWKLNAPVVRAFIDKSGDTVRWLEGKGVKFNLEPLLLNQTPLVFHCTEYGGSDIIKPLIKDCQNLGVQIFYQTRAMKLLTDKSETVIGVVAKTEGKDLIIQSKSVIIATGGFGANQELLKKYCHFYNEKIKNPGLKDVHMGDGLLMAMDIGAATEGLGNLQISGPGFRGESQSPLPPSFPASAAAKEPRGLRSIFSDPATIWVNRLGERFMEEACSTVFEMVHALLRQPEQVCFSIFDQSIIQNVTRNGFAKSYRGRVVIPQLATIEKEIQKGTSEGIIKMSGSWDEIARWIGASPETLIATIDEYNACCDRGYDNLCAKDRKYLQPLRTPPYYAMKGFPSFLTTLGGLKINHRMEVLDQKDKPIKGLYAAGNDTGGWETDTYNVHLSGTTCGFAINSGRIAGENAAKYVSSR